MKKFTQAMTVGMLMTAGMTLTACQSTPTPAPIYTPQITLHEPQILEILPQRASCDSATPMQCLLVRSQDDLSAIFGIGYNNIKGFEPKTGVSYKIKASQEIDQNTGRPTGFWQLQEVLSQHISR
ncbi:DUF4377 domain-containing protein [Moraxella sp.]|uniref:DUF4377 domain-containing protein n=1 Tax=Moraxella sp. TaxID=479 RepID=UPI0026DABE83|nr:DUF4377 domain-containing protein [Moraxella sp.]MDO4894497.1 DUF4377 domain-containing protein [Moraxella sp.]